MLKPKTYLWDANGNMIKQGSNINLTWDEENRLIGVTKSAMGVCFFYDAGGERFYKNSGPMTTLMVNGQQQTMPVYDNPVLYTSPYMVVTPDGYTKHYFVETERFASRVGDGNINGLNSHATTNAVLAAKQLRVNKDAPDSIMPNQFVFLHTLPAHWSSRHTTYWQHPDHLGSASWVTDTNGRGYQHLQYRAWGEPFIDQRVSGATYESRYTFSGKERDEETGFSYFGARHYHPALSIWLSVDPMSDKYPSTSPYTYCANNPVRLVDPDGKEIWIDGDEKSWTLKNLSTAYSNLNLSLDDNGKLRADVNSKSKLSEDEKHLLSTINSTQVSVHLTVNKENKYHNPIDNQDYESKLGGSFMGNQLSTDGLSVNTYQFVCKKTAQKYFFNDDIGAMLGHEITESYEGGLISIRNKTSASPAKDGLQNNIYEKSHSLAIECPLVKEVQRHNYWNERGVSYDKLKNKLNQVYGKCYTSNNPYLQKGIINLCQTLYIKSIHFIYKKKNTHISPPPSVYDSTYLWPYKIIGIDFMPIGALRMNDSKDFYLIHVIDTTETYAYTIISFCDENLESCQNPIEIGEFYHFTIIPLEKEADRNVVGGCYDRLADVYIDGAHIKVYPPARSYTIVSVSELKEIYYHPNYCSDEK